MALSISIVSTAYTNVLFSFNRKIEWVELQHPLFSTHGDEVFLFSFDMKHAPNQTRYLLECFNFNLALSQAFVSIF